MTAKARTFINSVSFTFAAIAAQASHAYVVSIDEFSVVRNGSAFFTDTFSDGVEPPSAPGGFSYDVDGTIPLTAESGGLLLLDTANGAISANALDQARRQVRVRLLTNTSNDPADFALGLKVDDTLSLTGIFSATTPSGVLNPQYAIRFADSPGGGVGADQILQLQVSFRTAEGEARIRFILQDFVANTITVLGSTLFNPGTADQILLNISRPNTSNHDFFGSFAYGTGGVFGLQTQFATPGQMFEGENFVRADFVTSDGVVPEPATLALLGLGLAALGFNRRRRA